MNLRIIIILLTVLTSSMHVNAQKIKNLIGEYTYHQPSDEPQSIAKAKAVKYAQNEAIAKEFGTIIHNQSIIRIEDDKVSHLMVGENEVKAQWIKDNHPPRFSFIVDPETGATLIKVKVEFQAREIITKAVQVKTHLLRNGTELNNEDNKFLSGDQMFLRFRSPISGFLLVYEQGEDEQVRRLLPYSRSKENAFYIESNKEYILFSSEHLYNGQKKNDVDEICFSTTKKAEYGRICVIFSPNAMDKPFDSDGGKVIGKNVGVNESRAMSVPRQLSFTDFQKWLSVSRLNDIRMNYIPIDVEIKRRW